MNFSLRACSNPGRYQKFFWGGVFLILCLIVLSRYQLLNGFTILSGDRYDAVISATILEHWFHVFSGEVNWAEVNYFFPYSRTIAQTDGYFLVGVAYYPFRLAGLDPFIAAELAGLVIKSWGFVGAYLLCRKVFSLSFYWALLAAILFTLSNGMTVHSSRLQLATVAFAPTMALLLWGMCNAFLDGDLAKFRKSGFFAGVLFGAWCLTCFYMAWFFTFLCTALLVVMFAKCDRHYFLIIKKRLSLHYGSVIFVVATALVALLPFMYAFLPKSFEVGVRSYKEVFGYTVPIHEILQVGHENFSWGRCYNAILSYVVPSYAPQGEYYNTGFAIVLFVLFACGCVRFMQPAEQQRSGFVLRSLIVATLVTWLMALRIAGHSAWFFVYHLFPGAKALRVVAAYQILLALPVVIIAVKYLSIQRFGLPITLLLVALLAIEEINTPYLNLDRHAELARIALPQLAPAQCRVFYTSGWAEQDPAGGEISNVYAHNVSAMLIAQFAGIPTINGFASFNPPGWDFGYPNKADYDERALAYAKKHGVTNLCRLDLNSKQWSVVE